MCFPQQKRRGDHTRYSLHSSRVVGSYPLQSKRATSRPHADMKTIRLITRKHFTYGVPQAKTYNKGMRSIIPMSIYPLLSSLTVILVKFPTLSKSQRTKRVINAFSIYGILNAISHHGEISFPNVCVDSKTLSFAHYRREDVCKGR
jgi:hypothetical protein